MFEPFIYDFGYSWPYLFAHLIVWAFFGALAFVAWRLRWPRWITAVASVVAIWAMSGALIVHYALDLNRPMRLPTAQFLASGSGRVLDVGAGSGRTTLMVLGAKPLTTVTALDIYGSGYFGIEGNTPDRIRANARTAGVDNRLDVHVSDMRKIELPSGSFDAVVSAYAIDHIPSKDVPTALGEVARLLKPHGQFLLMIINVDRWLRVAVPFLNIHGGSRSDEQARRWRDRLEAAGFDVVEQGTSPGTMYFLGQTRATDQTQHRGAH